MLGEQFDERARGPAAAREFGVELGKAGMEGGAPCIGEPRALPHEACRQALENLAHDVLRAMKGEGRQ